MKGFAEHDWRALARPGEVAAIYMGKKSARFIQGRLMMHGADRRHAGHGGRECQPAGSADSRHDIGRYGAGRWPT